MKKYSYILFDFDNTLWDFTQNSKQSLKELFEKHQRLQDKFKDFNHFYELYEHYNNKLWNDYREGKISKDALATNRFAMPLAQVGINEIEYATKLNSEYLAITTTKTLLIPNALEILKYLKEKGYQIYILTDGFFEVQFLKLKTSKLEPFVNQIITSEEIGVLKPNPLLFEKTLQKIGASKQQTIMIGDDYQNDILGAYRAGIDQIFFNRKNIDVSQLPIKPTYTITDLLEIKNIL